jgi:hypothetical protein
VNVLSGAPYGYRYIHRTDASEARYEVVADEATAVRELFRRYSESPLHHRQMQWASFCRGDTGTGHAFLWTNQSATAIRAGEFIHMSVNRAVISVYKLEQLLRPRENYPECSIWSNKYRFA